MPISLAEAVLRAQSAPNTGEVPLVLVTVEHPSLDPSLRLTSNPEVVTSRGEAYAPFPFDAVLPEFPAEGPPKTQIVFSNVHRAIPAWLLDAVGDIHVTIEIVPASDPDDVQVTSGRLLWVEAEGDVKEIRATIGATDSRRNPYPKRRFSPDLWPALFRAG